MNDKDLIDLIARTWINSGGDAEGFSWTYRKIQERIKELE
jgi:hypothetical protein